MSTQTDITGFFHMKKSKLSSTKQIAKAINADHSIVDGQITLLAGKGKETEKKVPLRERKRARSPALNPQNKRLKSQKKAAISAPKVNTIYKAFEKKRQVTKDADEESVSSECNEHEVSSSKASYYLCTPDAPVKLPETIQRKGKGSQETPARENFVEEGEHSKPSTAKKRLDMSPNFHLNQKLQHSPTRGALMLQRAAEKMGRPLLKESPVKASAVRNLFSSSSETKTGSTLAEKLEKCGRRKELAASLKKAGTSFQQLKKLREVESTPQLSKFEALSFEVNSPKKIQASPLKSPRRVPGSLVLPFKYRFLQELFYGLDTVVSMLHNRKETITWEKVKPAVQEMTRRNFLEKHLGQIWNVYPNGFEIKQEKAVARQFQKNASKYNLTIHPLLLGKGNSGSAEAGMYIQMDPKIMLQRRSTFHRNLVQQVKTHHRKFLSSLDPPVVIDDSQLTNWHRDFELEKIEDIKATPLPVPPTEETFNTAKDVLEKACINHPLMEEALRKRSQETEKKSATQEQKTETDKVKVPDALRGINPSLLAKIREKEAARVQRELTRGPKENKYREQLSRLPHVARIVRGIYVAEKKPAIPWSSVVDKLTYSHPTIMSNVESEEHLKLLIKEVPVWLVVHNLSSGRYLKINKNVDVNSVVSKLEKLLKA